MKVYQIIDDSMVDKTFATREGAAMRLLDIVQAARESSLLSGLLRVETLEVE